MNPHFFSRQLMPGMLTPEEMDRLAEAKGVEFDRLFLDFMIEHQLARRPDHGR